MNNENEVMEKAPVLTKKDCVKGAIRWSLMAVTTFNYDTQLAPAVVFGIGPLLRKIYKDDDEYVEALNNHYKYFNTMPWLANIVLGATLALEDKEGILFHGCCTEYQGQLNGTLMVSVIPYSGHCFLLSWAPLQDIWLWKATLSVLSCGSS